MSSQSDWWERNLEDYRQDGREDADKGIFNPPHSLYSEDPQDEDENYAYRQGFDARRQELGKKFRWQA